MIKDCKLHAWRSKLKIAKIVPVFKSGDETDPDNYRPISLLSIFNRIFEKVMYSRLISFMDKHNVLSSSQYGFRKQHSTQHAIHDIVNEIYKNMDNKEITCGIFIDLKGHSTPRTSVAHKKALYEPTLE